MKRICGLWVANCSEVAIRVLRAASLPSIEAMTMVTVPTAERECTAKSVHVKPGDVVSAKDLLAENQ